MTKALLILLSNTSEDADHALFNRWYDETHVPEILRIAGIRSCRRYRLARTSLLPGVLQPNGHEYAAVYEVEADSEAAIENLATRMNAAFASMAISPTIDVRRSMSLFLLPVSAEQKAPGV